MKIVALCIDAYKTKLSRNESDVYVRFYCFVLHYVKAYLLQITLFIPALSNKLQIRDSNPELLTEARLFANLLPEYQLLRNKASLQRILDRPLEDL